MMELHVDVGNTRLKWRIIQGGRVLTREIGSIDLFEQRVNQQIFSKALISSVASDELNARIADNLACADVQNVFWAKTSADFGRIKNAYKDYGRLGVDRWLAIIAAYQAKQSDLLVFDFGTALTVDIVESSGEHKGGYIVPGAHLCRTALLNKAAFGFLERDMEPSDSPGNNTELCIEHGIYAMQKSFVNSILSRYPLFKSVVTGGGFHFVESVFAGVDYVFEPDLVLDGLLLASSDLGDSQRCGD